jgi:hypothetical protein
MGDHPDPEAEGIPPESQPPCPGPAVSAGRRFDSFKGPVIGAMVGSVLCAGLYYGAAVIYLGVIQDCWG